MNVVEDTNSASIAALQIAKRTRPEKCAVTSINPVPPSSAHLRVLVQTLTDLSRKDGGLLAEEIRRTLTTAALERPGFWLEREEWLTEILLLSGLDAKDLATLYYKGLRSDHEEWRRSTKPRLFQEVLRTVYNATLYPALEAVDFLVDRSAIERAAFTFQFAASLNLAKAQVCDIGIGCGEIMLGLTKIAPDALVHGIDISESAIGFVRRRAAIRGLNHRINLMYGDIRSPPFIDGLFRLTIANEVIEHVEDPVAALKQISRITQPGGHVVIATSIRFPCTQHLGEFGSSLDFESALEQAHLTRQSTVYLPSTTDGHGFTDLFVACQRRVP